MKHIQATNYKLQATNYKPQATKRETSYSITMRKYKRMRMIEDIILYLGAVGIVALFAVFIATL